MSFAVKEKMDKMVKLTMINKFKPKPSVNVSEDSSLSYLDHTYG